MSVVLQKRWISPSSAVTLVVTKSATAKATAEMQAQSSDLRVLSALAVVSGTAVRGVVTNKARTSLDVARTAGRKQWRNQFKL